MITNFLPHAAAALLLLTTQLAFANEYRFLQDHSHELLGQVKDLRWLAEDVMVNHPDRRSVLRDIDHLRSVARELDEVIYEQERLPKIIDELVHFQEDVADLREKLTGRVAGRGHFRRQFGPSIAVGGCMPGQDPVAFLLNKTFELDATTRCMEEVLGMTHDHHHSHNGGAPMIVPPYQAPVPVPYEVRPPQYSQPQNSFPQNNTVPQAPLLPPPFPSQSWNHGKNPQQMFSGRPSNGTTIDVGGVKLTFAR
ncbi:hypothetical protein [Lacunimicrobium album]